MEVWGHAGPSRGNWAAPLAEEAIHAALWDYAEKHGIKIQGLEKPKSDISEHDEDEEY